MTLRPRRRMRAAAPQQQEPSQRGGGEQLDSAAEESIRLAHRALDRFPDLVRRHKYVAGGAAVAGALVVLASVALARRMSRGESADEAIQGLTEAEIESLHPRDRDDDSDSEAAVEPDDTNAPGAQVTPIAAHANGTNGTNGTSATVHHRDAPGA